MEKRKNTGRIPVRWKKAIVKFIPKPQKKALRPISLMNCIGKLLEKIVNKRLRIWAEEGGNMDPNQSGFTRERSTMDNINILVNSIRESWEKGETVISAFVDVKAAYDNVRHDKLEEILEGMSCPERVRNYLKAWLKGRMVEVASMGGECIQMKLLKGLPQGSVLSPLLYNLYTRGAANGLREFGVRILQYADDIVIFVAFKDKREGRRILEEALMGLNRNLGSLGLRIAADKTQVVTFPHMKRGGWIGRMEIRIGDERTEEVEAAKFLGMWIDRSLSFRKHTEYVAIKTRKRMNILKCIDGVRKETGPETMLKVFKALIRSVIEYGAHLYLNNNKNKQSG
nr:PREDICTED: RNA-directed DNA polymerase from mobile element jockey-like [Megachile rotundata]